MVKEAQAQEKSISDSGEIVLRGTVERVTFRNPDNGYSVIQIQTLEETQQITVVGSTMEELHSGVDVVVRGNYIQHPRYGQQLQAVSITVAEPSTPEHIERYLSSGMFHGIGPVTAKKLVEEFGEKTLEAIYRHPEKIARIDGMSEKKAQAIHLALSEQEEVKEVMRYLVEHNISPGLANRIFKRYGQRAIEVLERDPYILARQMKGVGFTTADSIALNLGMQTDSPERLKAGVYYALEKARDDGHCYLPEDVLRQRAGFLLGLGEALDLDPAINELIQDDYIVRVDTALYLRPLYVAEQYVAEFVAKKTSPREDPEISEIEVEAALSRAEKELAIQFSVEQREAVQLAAKHPLLVLTGGPGCGKTTVIRALVRTFMDANKRIALCAPTGRAAQRMSQVCNLPAKTIHRLLRYDPLSGGFLHGHDTPLEEDGEPIDVVIVDESSMIDIQLAKDLFSALPSKATLILVGDRDQLPSVGPGRVFADLIAVKDVKTINLSRLFRREATSSINDIAFSINAGITPDIPTPDGKTRVDAYFIPKRSAEEAAQMVELLIADQIPKKFDIPTDDITVLTPSNRGPLGVLALNEKLQERLNPAENKPYVLVNNQKMRVGDKVCQRANNYNIDPYGVFNGDSGRIHSLDPKEKLLRVELWDGRIIDYQERDLTQLALSYAMTVHRSQGSEMPCVVLALHESHYTLLERQLIYTAVTRAKKLLVVVGSKKALNLACQRTTSKKRCTMLAEEISKALL